jgi:hypothetical protein
MTTAERKFGLRDFYRVALWGVAAAGALAVTAYASTTKPGTERLMLAAAEIQALFWQTGERRATAYDPKEARRLAETVRMLTADRERLVTRIASLEQSVDDITGSIARATQAPPAPAAPVVPAPEEAAPAPSQPEPPPNEGVTKTQFGIDIGRATTIDGLRALWTAARNRHPALLEGLRPIVNLRESSRPGGIELRLVAGPIANAAGAARLCASLSAAGAACHPAVFDGQRLALR